MPKRKLDQAFGAKNEKRLQEIRDTRIKGKLHHGKKVFQRSMKLAKSFERRKLIRRYKIAQAENQDAEIRRIGGDLQALKDLDTASIAEVYLRKTILKDKQISTDLLVLEILPEVDRATTDQKTANVIARLCNSKPVKEAVGEVVEGLHIAMGIQQPNVKNSMPMRNKDKSKISQSADKDGIEDDSSGDVHDSEHLGHTTSDEVESQNDPEDGVSSDERFTKFHSRFAQDSDEESLDDRDIALAKSLKEKLKPIDTRELSTSDLRSSPNASLNKQNSPDPIPTLKARTAFLPSLTLTGYISGSESNSSDDEKVSNPKTRQNRRGQRARQQIWEQKYGAGAKHLQESKKEGKVPRDAGWDMKRGARPSAYMTDKRLDERQMRFKKNDQRGGTEKIDTKAHEKHGGKRGEALSKDLHPSWEAARKAKEQKTMGLSDFKGKKIVFD